MRDIVGSPITFGAYGTSQRGMAGLLPPPPAASQPPYSGLLPGWKQRGNSRVKVLSASSVHFSINLFRPTNGSVGAAVAAALAVARSATRTKLPAIVRIGVGRVNGRLGLGEKKSVIQPHHTPAQPSTPSATPHLASVAAGVVLVCRESRRATESQGRHRHCSSDCDLALGPNDNNAALLAIPGGGTWWGRGEKRLRVVQRLRDPRLHTSACRTQPGYCTAAPTPPAPRTGRWSWSRRLQVTIRTSVYYPDTPFFPPTHQCGRPSSVNS